VKEIFPYFAMEGLADVFDEASLKKCGIR